MSTRPTPAGCFAALAGVSAPLIIAGAAALSMTDAPFLVRWLVFVLVATVITALVLGIHAFTRTTPVPVREEVKTHG
jgi:hypothetical protein